MEEWKSLSPKRKEKLNFATMMFAAKEANIRGLLTFKQNEPLCEETETFTFDLPGNVSGTVTLKPHPDDPNLLGVLFETQNVYVKSYLYDIGATFTPWTHFIPKNIYAIGSVPSAIVDLALNPPTMQDVFA